MNARTTACELVYTYSIFYWTLDPHVIGTKMDPLCLAGLSVYSAAIDRTINLNSRQLPEKEKYTVKL